jgi:hypothetical protein
VSDLRKAIREKTTNNLLGTVHHIPVSDDLRLLIALVPDGTHDQECRLADSLEYTKQGPDYNEGGKAEAKSMAAENRGPTHDVNREKFSNGDSLDRPVDGVFDDQNGNVYAGCKPSPLSVVSKELQQLV